MSSTNLGTFPNGSPLKVDDLFDQAKPFLTKKAIKALENSLKHTQLYIVDGEIVGECVYIGYKVESTKIEKAIKSISRKLNRLASKGHILACLAPMIKLDLTPETTGYDKPLQSVVISYVHVPNEIYKEIMSKVPRKAAMPNTDPRLKLP
jgi:hypothetical protein